MPNNSIAFRLFWLSAGWLIVALVATAFLLTELYARALDDSLSASLDFHIATLVGQALEADALNGGDIAAADARFTRPLSGWYWEIRGEDGTAMAFSPSLLGTILPPLDAAFSANNARDGVVATETGQRLRVVERRITLNDAHAITITVAGNLSEVDEQAQDFRGQAIIVLAAVGLALAVMSALIARVALRPVGMLRAAVEAVREGEARSVEGRFPVEIAPLADEVNELLRSNAQIIERARNQVGNLAHGLKTPLAVLRNETAAGQSELSRLVASETATMERLVAAYLDKARLAARTAIVGRKTDTGAVLTRLVRVMGKLHGQRDFEADLAPDLPWFRGDEGDLEEMVGNLADNAGKWSRRHVRLSARAESEPNRGLCICVEDDGPGLTPENAAKVLRRGVRLDEKTPGSGLGLDIVKELVDVYGGNLTLERSELGGLRATLVLPASRSRTQGAGA